MSAATPILTMTPSTLTNANSATMFQSSTPGTLTRTLSEGELSNYSSVSSIRDTLVSARRTRESIRKSRASLQVLREEARQTLVEVNDLRREMHLLLRPRHARKTSTEVYESDHESDSGESHPTVGSEVSDLTFEMM